MKTAYIAGGNGFIGHHLARRLKKDGYWVRVVDVKEYEYGANDYADEVLIYDLRDPVLAGSTLYLDESFTYSFLPKPFTKQIQFDEVYNLACLMGGMGFIGNPEHEFDIMVGSTDITLNVLNSAIEKGAKKIFYSSSACVYNENLQNQYDVSLSEGDAYPAMPDLVYGWQKLFSEQLHQASKSKIEIRIARFHNIYGPEGTYKGGKEKAPAAMCRKVIECHKDLHKEKFDEMSDRWYGGFEIEIWGTGHQTRSFLYIDDCLDAVRLLMESDFKEPINIGSEEMVTINQLAEMAIGFSGKTISIKHISGPTGVMGRNSNNELIREKLGWEPKYKLKEGLKLTFDWISKEMGK